MCTRAYFRSSLTGTDSPARQPDLDATACCRLAAGSGGPGATALGESLKSNTSLKELNLDECDIGAEGAEAFATDDDARAAAAVLMVFASALGPVTVGAALDATVSIEVIIWVSVAITIGTSALAWLGLRRA